MQVGGSALVNVIIVGGYVDANNLLTRGEGGSKNPDFMLTLFVHGPYLLVKLLTL